MPKITASIWCKLVKGHGTTVALVFICFIDLSKFGRAHIWHLWLFLKLAGVEGLKARRILGELNRGVISHLVERDVAEVRNDRGQVLLLQRLKLLQLPPRIFLVFLLSLEQQSLGLVLVRQSVMVVVEQLLSLLDHKFEKGVWGHLEVSLHCINFIVRENQALRVRYTLHCEEPLVQALYSISLELEGVVLFVVIMDLGRRVDHRVLCTKVLHHALSPRFL